MNYNNQFYNNFKQLEINYTTASYHLPLKQDPDILHAFKHKVTAVRSQT